MQLSDESIQEFKEIFKKEYGKEYTDSEAREAAKNLVGFFDLLIKVDQRNKQNKNKSNAGKDDYEL
ncbi:hypothetical protein M1615_03300 [Patescibacteria group bacterium]|nr:hypothetical protein [Patescibacteria group bacterium]